MGGQAPAPWEQVGSAGVSEPRTFALKTGVDLSSGRRLEQVEVSYETYGRLDEHASNAVLVCHALSGDAHVAGWRPGDDPETARPGWWDIMVGPGKAMDTDRFFVVCSNVLGGCAGTTGPCSPDLVTGRPYGLRFPLVTVEDMVDVQARLLDVLGVRRLAAVVGGSMGGFQALAWAKRHPERVGAVGAIATTPRLGAQAIAFNEVGRRAILEDPRFADGDYFGREEQPDSGLAIARMVGHITYLSDASMRAKFGRRLRERDAYAFEFVHEFEVESYLAHQGRRFVERFDADTYLYMTKAMDYFDLRGESSTLAEALAGVSARFLVTAFSSDWLFPPADARELTTALLAAGVEVAYGLIDSPYGHDAFLLEPAAQHAYLAPFLDVALAESRERAAEEAGAR